MRTAGYLPRAALILRGCVGNSHGPSRQMQQARKATKASRPTVTPRTGDALYHLGHVEGKDGKSPT